MLPNSYTSQSHGLTAVQGRPFRKALIFRQAAGRRPRRGQMARDSRYLQVQRGVVLEGILALIVSQGVLRFARICCARFVRVRPPEVMERFH